MIQKIRGEWPKHLGDYKTLKMTLPPIIANETKNHFLEGFRQGGKQTDTSINGWKARKKEYGKRGRRSNRALLVDTGRMRADLKIRRISFNSIIVGIRNIPYAVYHNDGTEKMPQREMIGQSKKLDKKIIAIIVAEFKKLLK